MGKAHYVRNEIKDSIACFRQALKLDPYYDEVWFDLGRIIRKEDLASRAISYLEDAYKVTGDVPGINYLLASFYLQTGSHDKAYTHLSLALEMDKDLFTDFSEFFPRSILTRKIIRLLKKNNLI